MWIQDLYNRQKLNTIIGRWLNLIMVLALVVASVVGLIMQDRFQKQRTFSMLEGYLTDYSEEFNIDLEVNNYCDSWMEYAIDGEETAGKEEYFSDSRLTRTVLNNSDLISELSIVDESGIVAYSSNPDLVGFDLRDSDHTAPFISLLEGETAYADTFYPSPFTDSIDMAYVGRTFRDGSGFVLFGINEEAYKYWWDSEIIDTTNDLRIGVTGFFINCNPDMSVNCTSFIMAKEVGDTFSREDLLPENVGDIKETITEFYGKKCYVAAFRDSGFYIIGAYPAKEANQFEVQNNILFVVLFFMILAAFLGAVLNMLKRYVVKDVEKTHDTLRLITEGNLEEKADAGNSLEFFELSNGINDTVDKLKDLIEAENRRIQTELENARNIQESAVPGVFPPFPEDERFGLFASMDTAEAVGGDFYDFFMVDDNTLCVVMADVSGKGMPAALYMMRAKTLIRTYAEQGLGVDEVAINTNLSLCEDKSAEMFVTAWIGMIDLRTGVVNYVHAGHTPPVRFGSETGFVKQKINMVLGGLKKAKYVCQQVTLSPGESIYLYTDGVSEARDVDANMYGEDRLLSFLDEKASSADASDRNEYCENICRMVLKDLRQFADGAEQYDDITMLCFKYMG